MNDEYVTLKDLWPVLSILVFWVVAYIMGVIREYRESKFFLKPNVRYFSNIFRSTAMVIKSLSGVIFPVPCIERSDAYYYNPTYDEFYEALLVVHEMMIAGGWSVENYQRRSKDCEDYAMKMAVEIRNYIATTFLDNVGEKGVAVGNIAYVRDSDGAGHVIVKALLEDGVKYYEPYPMEKFLNEKILTRSELDSINMDIM